jgi:murein DD-endopeptidase MepM/ murein hydrolase activator NlpD
MSQKTKQPLYSELFEFFTAISAYIFHRIRLIAVLAVAAFEVGMEVVENIKRGILRYMFWGRVKGYRIVVAGLLVFLFLVVPFVFYRDPITVNTYAVEENAYETVAKNDLLIEQGSSQTLIPKSRSRMEVMSYTVKGGDTLGGIAERFDLRQDTILWANNIENKDLIKPGMELKIPPGDGVLHKVKSGDTLAALADEYDASQQAIADVNWIDPPFTLTDGVTLFIPDGTMPPPPEPDPKPVVASTPSSSGSSSSGGRSGGSTGTYVPNPSGNRFLNWPVAGGAGRVTQCFSGWHNGIDIANSSWPNVVAASSGTVTFAGCQSGSCPAPGSSIGGYGLAWAVIVDHGNGYSTVYGHLNQIYVSSGQYVGAGTAIGQMGRSGTATGVHLHFMVVRSGTWSALNPAPFMTTHVCGY